MSAADEAAYAAAMKALDALPRARRPAIEPLLELLVALAREGRVPLAWAFEHAREGDLRAAWEACDELSLLLRLCCAAGDVVRVVRWGCATTRGTLLALPPDEVRPLRAVEAAEAWAAYGERSDPHVAVLWDAYENAKGATARFRKAFERALVERGEGADAASGDLAMGARFASSMADDAVYVAFAAARGDDELAATSAVGLTCLARIEASRILPDVPFERPSVRCARLVRAELVCPTIDQLERYGRHAERAALCRTPVRRRPTESLSLRVVARRGVPCAPLPWPPAATFPTRSAR